MCAASEAVRARRDAAEGLLHSLQAREALWQREDSRAMKALHPVPENNEELSELFLKVVGVGNG